MNSFSSVFIIIFAYVVSAYAIIITLVLTHVLINNAILKSKISTQKKKHQDLEKIYNFIKTNKHSFNHITDSEFRFIEQLRACPTNIVKSVEATISEYTR